MLITSLLYCPRADLKLKNGARVSAGVAGAGERKGRQNPHAHQQHERGRERGQQQRQRGAASAGGKRSNLSSSSQFFSALSARVEQHRPHKRPFAASAATAASHSGGKSKKHKR